MLPHNSFKYFHLNNPIWVNSFYVVVSFWYFIPTNIKFFSTLGFYKKRFSGAHYFDSSITHVMSQKCALYLKKLGANVNTDSDKVTIFEYKLSGHILVR